MPTPSAPGGNGTPAPFESQATKFSESNALRLSMLANAYLTRSDAQRAANDLGLPRFEWIDLAEQFRDLYGFAAGCDDYAVLAFCGITNPKDQMTNLNAAPACYNQLLRSRTVRFVNREDLVPRVPFRGWDYADVGNMIHFDNAGSPVLESQHRRNFLSRSIEGFQEFFNISTHFSAHVGDHDYRQYETLIATLQSELTALSFA